MKCLNVFIGLFIIGSGFIACQKDNITDFAQSFNEKNDLYIPPLIDSRVHAGAISISIQNGNHQFFENMNSQTRGFNGNYLGPTIRMHKGDSTHLLFTNNIGETTTVHGHGLHVPGHLDGGPQLKIQPGATWDVILPINQEASTNWYHPHLMGKTAPHVHSGLAGFYLIEDNNSQALNLPKTYGVDDIPLAIQDRTFVNGQMVVYPEGQMEDLREPTLVINGTIDPYLSVPKGNVRLRLLNASNSRSYDFFIKGNLPFYKIATEGGFLNAPVQLTRLSMAPGERNEIIIDMSNGDVELMAYYLAPKEKHGTESNPKSRVLYLEVDENMTPPNTNLSQSLNNIQPHIASNVVKTRYFDLEDMKINGKSMDMNIINERVNKGELEKWTVSSGRHPFHMHGASFLILSINNQPPLLEDQGWKDVIMPYGDAEVLIRFDYEATDQFPYMYHCHLLEHEDHGMMGQFTVQ